MTFASTFCYMHKQISFEFGWQPLATKAHGRCYPCCMATLEKVYHGTSSKYYVKGQKEVKESDFGW